MTKDDDSGKSYYQELKSQNEQMKAKLSVLESEGFLLRRDVDIENLYFYLKKNPKAAQFIYRKYATVRDTLKEICDPQNPLFIEAIATELKDTMEVTEHNDDISSLKSEKNRLLQERSKVDNELKERESEYNRLSTESEELNKKLDDAQRIIANLTTQEARKRITDFYGIVKEFIEGVWKAQNGRPITEAISSVLLNWDQINLLKAIEKKVELDLDYLNNKDLLSQEMLDQKRKEIKEQMDKEQDEALRAMDSFMAHNPIKTVRKAIDGIELVQKQLDQGEPTMDGGGAVFFYLRAIGIMKGNLDIPLNLLTNLKNQFETAEIRREGEK